MRRTFPIMLDANFNNLRRDGACVAVIALPWEMLFPHQAQAIRNHSQDLQMLASRGGLSACEAVAVLEDRRWSRMGEPDAHARLLDLLARFEAQP